MSLTIHVFMSWLTSASWCWPFMSWLRGIFMHPIISSSFDQTGFSRIFCGWLVFFRVIHSVWSRSPKLLFFLLGEKNNLPAAKRWVQKTSPTVAVHPHKRRHMIDGISQTATEGREVWWLSWFPRRWWQAPRPTPTESVCNWRIFRNAWPVGRSACMKRKGSDPGSTVKVKVAWHCGDARWCCCWWTTLVRSWCAL